MKHLVLRLSPLIANETRLIVPDSVALFRLDVRAPNSDTRADRIPFTGLARDLIYLVMLPNIEFP